MTMNMSMRFLVSVVSVLVCLNATVTAQNTEMALKAGDRIALSIGGIPADDAAQISKVYTIGDGGTINLVHVGEVKAVGFKPSELQRVVEKTYVQDELYKSPTVTVTIDGGEVPARLVYVVSGCKKNGPVAYNAGLTLLKAISVAGGFSDFAKPSQTKVIRDGKSIAVDLRNVGSEPAKDMKLEPEDQIIVRE
ncbi:polysaccharide biosynthesis/export family protein [Prosthecobacter sp.]|uniref:polysaccharide biosynthesis/export family protein n=1 Tax=Prosthecobacter sp. TaxID=1965333 RepID=UPI00378327F0